MTQRILTFASNLRVGFFLALRQLRRSNPWTTALIILVMILTFLNLVVLSGILVGLTEGAIRAVREKYTGDVIITAPREKQFIENSTRVINTVENFPEVSSYTARYTEGGTAESNYKTPGRETDKPEEVAVTFAGIDPEKEDETTGLSDLLVEGTYLEDDDFDQVMIGALLLRRYLDFESELFLTLEDVYVGDTIRVRIGDVTREVTVKGILKSKVDEIDRRIFFTDKQFRTLVGREDFNVDEISMKLISGANPVSVRDGLIASGIDSSFAKVQTFEDAQPKFLKDIQQTFRLLGNIVSSLGLFVASITVFIVIFINALTRRKFIGILKGIGIDGRAIEMSYVIQSFFYAIVGATVGISITYLILVPFFQKYPIDFPFSDGILVAPPFEVGISALLLIVITIIAGYVPSRMIVRKNTLDSILGR